MESVKFADLVHTKKVYTAVLRDEYDSWRAHNEMVDILKGARLIYAYADENDFIVTYGTSKLDFFQVRYTSGGKLSIQQLFAVDKKIDDPFED